MKYRVGDFDKRQQYQLHQVIGDSLKCVWVAASSYDVTAPFDISEAEDWLPNKPKVACGTKLLQISTDNTWVITQTDTNCINMFCLERSVIWSWEQTQVSNIKDISKKELTYLIGNCNIEDFEIISDDD